MVYLCGFQCCCDDYTKYCCYKCRNKFNYTHFDDLKWSLILCPYICDDDDNLSCIYIIGATLAIPFAFTFDIISCPCRCCYSFCNKCDCEKVDTQAQELKKKNKNVSIIIADQPPLYNDHHKHQNVVDPVIALPPIYTA